MVICLAVILDLVEIYTHYPYLIHIDLSSSNFCIYFVASEIQKMHCLARDHSRRIFEENEGLRLQLDAKRKELDERCQQLDKLVAQNDTEMSKLAVEKQKVIFSVTIHCACT